MAQRRRAEWQAAAAAIAHPQLLLAAEEQEGGKKPQKSKGGRIVPYQNDPQALEKLLLEPGGLGFSKVLSIVTLYRAYTRALTFENLWKGGTKNPRVGSSGGPRCVRVFRV